MSKQNANKHASIRNLPVQRLRSPAPDALCTCGDVWDEHRHAARFPTATARGRAMTKVFRVSLTIVYLTTLYLALRSF
jgi:hypothetical protein